MFVYLGVVLLVISVVMFLLDRYSQLRFPSDVTGVVAGVGGTLIVVGLVLGAFSEGYSFNKVIEELMQQERQGLVPTINKKQFDRYFQAHCIVLKKEDVTPEDQESEDKVTEVEVAGNDVVLKKNGDEVASSSSSKENFRWTRYGRYSKGRWRGYPYYRYWRFPYTRFIRYPYVVQGPARWVTYNGDYYYVTY